MQPASQTPPKRQLVSRTVPANDVDGDMLTAAFALFQDTYAGAVRARFETDLRDKQLVILLFDRDTDELKGFSTVRVERMPSGATVIFSGDTVIHRDYWGQKRLQIAFSRILLWNKLRSPTRPIYWFLISKGYRTYMLLANAFPVAVPRFDTADNPLLRSLLDKLATGRFGARYDAPSGIVTNTTGHERVRAGVAPITAQHLENPHVKFFLSRNPGHSDGDELACLAEVRLRDLARIGARIVIALVRRRLGARRPEAQGIVEHGVQAS
jgi:hypothetical protein